MIDVQTPAFRASDPISSEISAAAITASGRRGTHQRIAAAAAAAAAATHPAPAGLSDDERDALELCEAFVNGSIYGATKYSIGEVCAALRRLSGGATQEHKE